MSKCISKCVCLEYGGSDSSRVSEFLSASLSGLSAVSLLPSLSISLAWLRACRSISTAELVVAASDEKLSFLVNIFAVTMFLD